MLISSKYMQFIAEIFWNILSYKKYNISFFGKNNMFRVHSLQSEIWYWVLRYS